MNKIYTSGNYIIVEVDGKIKPFPMGTSEYNEAIDHFILRKYPNKDVQIFSFLDIFNGTWTDESGTVPFVKESLRFLLRDNTGKSSGGGVGVGSTSKLYKYTVDVFDDLFTITDAEEGDIARVYSSQGVWLLGTLKSEGAYTYENGAWIYGSRSLQAEIVQNDADILDLQNRMLLKLDSVIAGDNISINNSNSTNPIISSLADKYRTTSTTTNEIVSTGFLDFLIDIGLSYIPNQKVLLDASADNYMIGHVESYNQFTGELRVHIEHKKGSGTFSSWNIGLGSVIIEPVVWGSIGGSILNQTDLQAEFSQIDADILSIQNTLPNKVDKEFLGWVQVTDGQYTSAAPYTISQDVKTKLTNDSSNVLNVTNLFGATTLWNSVANKFENDNYGDSFSMRVQFVANANINNSYITLDLDIGGTQGVIWSKTIQLVRGVGVNNKVTENIHFYTLNTFIANGGELYLTSNNSVDIFDIRFLIERSYRHG